MRRVVTADRDGKSVIASDGTPPLTRAFEATPGFVSSVIWSTESVTVVPLSGSDPTLDFSAMVPEVGATRLITITLPPDTVMMNSEWDPVKAAEENAGHLFGLDACFETAVPGMHRTDTVDYGVVVSGSVTLEVDDGATRDLVAGDVIVQGGVRHAWRNRSDSPVQLLFVLIGAKRSN